MLMNKEKRKSNQGGSEASSSVPSYKENCSRLEELKVE